MLENDSHNGSCEKRGADALFVQGSTFTNTAAKFWSSLIDEVHSDHPQCDTIVLDTLTDKMLSRELLFPQASLQYELDRHMPVENVRQALREALADFDLIGPPDSVHVRLLSEDVECKRCDLPFDCVDADIFSCLIVWLLEWSEIPEFLWNNVSVDGAFYAGDRDRALRYHLRITLSNQHVSEGLFRRMLTICFDRRKEGLLQSQ
ncbi:hypothetical protein ACFLQR_02930 [Verrucomicrobiota bacterium]